MVTFFADPSINLDVVEQEGNVTVYGWVEPGRAVLVDVGPQRLLALTPCTSRGIRLPRLSAG